MTPYLTQALGGKSPTPAGSQPLGRLRGPAEPKVTFKQGEGDEVNKRDCFCFVFLIFDQALVLNSPNN